jgi:hypothetical protein
MTPFEEWFKATFLKPVEDALHWEFPLDELKEAFEAGYDKAVADAVDRYSEGQYNGEVWDYFGAASDAILRLSID